MGYATKLVILKRGGTKLRNQINLLKRELHEGFGSTVEVHKGEREDADT